MMQAAEGTWRRLQHVSKRKQQDAAQMGRQFCNVPTVFGAGHHVGIGRRQAAVQLVGRVLVPCSATQTRLAEW